jgi:hypothetical protein
MIREIVIEQLSPEVIIIVFFGQGGQPNLGNDSLRNQQLPFACFTRKFSLGKGH